jgi:guanylate kinase
VRQHSLQVIPTWTTRPKRRDEVEVGHYFANREEFAVKLAEGFFIKADQPFDAEWYGLPRVMMIEPGRLAVVILRANYVSLARQHHQNLRIYQLEVEPEIWRQRLIERGYTEDAATEQRLMDELDQGRQVADRLFQSDSSLRHQVMNAIELDFGY